MRNFRTVAVATATAVTVAFAGTSVASAEDLPAVAQNIATAASSEGEGTLSSKVGAVTQSTTEVTGENLLGQRVNDGDNETDPTANPSWAKIWREVTYALLGTSVLSVLVAAYNLGVYNGTLPAVFGNPYQR